MKLSIPNCPECSQPATGTLEAVQGVALLQGPDSKGSFEYIATFERDGGQEEVYE